MADTTHSLILVTGATGKTGRRVIPLLRDRGYAVREVSRHTEIPFDWDNTATWAPALENVTAVYVIPPAGPDAIAQYRDFGALAVASGVKKAVVISTPDTGYESYKEVTAAENALVESGLATTFLRLRWFNQNFDEDFFYPFVVAGDLRLPAGDAREAFVDADDIAAVAVEALTDRAHNGQAYDVSGPRLLSFAEVAEEISRATGNTVTYTALTNEEFKAEQRAQGVPDEWVELSTELYGGIVSGAYATVSGDVEKVLGRPAKDFSDYVANAARAGAWAN